MPEADSHLEAVIRGFLALIICGSLVALAALVIWAVAQIIPQMTFDEIAMIALAVGATVFLSWLVGGGLYAKRWK